MDPTSFDRLSREVSTSSNRRSTLLRLVGASVAGVGLAATRAGSAGAADTRPSRAQLEALLEDAKATTGAVTEDAASSRASKARSPKCACEEFRGVITGFTFAICLTSPAVSSEKSLDKCLAQGNRCALLAGKCKNEGPCINQWLNR